MPIQAQCGGRIMALPIFLLKLEGDGWSKPCHDRSSPREVPITIIEEAG